MASASAWAQKPLLGGPLGTWLESKAAPELVRVFGKHPKFKGQRIKFVTLKDGSPADTANHLTRAVKQQLTHQILRDGKNDVAWSNDHPVCPTVEVAPYLLGVEISSHGRYNHQVRLAVLDTEEGVWVSGLSLSWTGRLLESERAALKKEVSSAPRGSIGNPIPVTNRSRLVETVNAQLRCTLRSGLDGTVVITQSSEPHVQLFLRDLEQTLALESTLVLTQSADDASWQLAAGVEPAGFNMQQLNLNVVSPDDPTAAQRIASIFVTGAGQTVPSPQVTAAMPKGPLIVDQALPKQEQAELPVQVRSGSLQLAKQLLGQPKISEPRRPCKSGHRCAEISFDLLASAYVVVFRTSNAQIRPATCTRKDLRRDDGQHRFRVTLAKEENLSSGPDAGFYVIASHDRGVMERIAHHVRRAPGACDIAVGNGGRSGWMKDFTALLDQHGDALDWQALHLRATPQRIVTL